MARCLGTFAVLGGVVLGLGCASSNAQKPPAIESDPPESLSTSPPLAPATQAGAASSAPGAPNPSPGSDVAVAMGRPTLPTRTRTYPFPVATLPGFEMLPDGSSRVFVEVTRKVDVEERRTARVLTYVLKGARVVYRNNENALETMHFNTPVSRARLLPRGRDLIFTVDLRADSSATWKMVPEDDGSSTLEVDFPAGSFLAVVDPNAPVQAVAPPAAPVAKAPQSTPRAGKGGGWRGSNKGTSSVVAVPAPSSAPADASGGTAVPGN